MYFFLFGELQGWQVCDEILNFAFNQQKRAENIFKKIVAPNIISEETRISLEPACTGSGIMYGLCKVDGVAMGSHLGLMLANAFLVHFEKNWLQNCPFDLKPYYYRQYVDDICFFLPHQNI